MVDVGKQVTCLEAFGESGGNGVVGNAVVVCTAGRDGRVRVLDPRSGAVVGEVGDGEC